MSVIMQDKVQFGILLYRAKQFEKARRVFQTILLEYENQAKPVRWNEETFPEEAKGNQENKKCALLHYHLGLCTLPLVQEDAKWRDRAIECFRRAIECDAEFVEARINLSGEK